MCILFFRLIARFGPDCHIIMCGKILLRHNDISLPDQTKVSCLLFNHDMWCHLSLTIISYLHFSSCIGHNHHRPTWMPADGVCNLQTTLYNDLHIQKILESLESLGAAKNGNEHGIS